MKKTVLLILFFFSFLNSFGQYNKPYFYYAAHRAMSQSNFRQAIDLMTMLIEVDDKDYEAYFTRAIAKYNMNDIMGADIDFSSAINLNKAYAQAYQYRAIVRSMMGNYNDALNDFQRAIDVRPDITGSYYSRGVTYFLNQQFDKAISDFNVCIAKDPKMTDSYIIRGTSYLMQKDTVSALNDYNKALEIDPRNSNAYVRRGAIYSQKKDYASAFEDYNRAILNDTVSVAAYFNRASAYAQSNNPIKAVEDFSRIVKIDPKNSFTYFNRAILYGQIGDYNKALEDYDKVVELTPNNVLGIYNRAMLNSKLGNLTAAILDYTKAIELYPDFANAYLNRANLRYLLQDKQGAESDKAIAESKIEAYRSKMDNESFSSFVDTSKVFNKLLSFDLDFGNRDFDAVRGNAFDIKQLPQFRITIYQDNEIVKMNRMYVVDELNDFLKNFGVKGVILAYKVVDSNNNRLLRSYMERRPNIPMSNVYKWKDDFFDGLLQNSMKQFTNSVAYYTSAIEQNNSSPFLYMNRAVALTEMTEFISSLDSKTQKMVIGVDKAQEMNNISKVYDYDEALRDINKAISLNPDVAYFYYNRAVIYCLMGDMPSAIDNYTKALDLYPNFAEALYNRGMIQLYIKDTKKGFIDLSRAGELGVTEAYSVIKTYSKLLQ